MAGRLLSEPWSSSPGWRERRARARTDRAARQRRSTYARLDIGARAAPRPACRGRRAGRSLALPARERLRRRAARLPAGRRARRADRPAADRRPSAARSTAVEPATSRERRARPRGTAGGAPRPRRPRDPRPHLGHDRRAQARPLTYGNWLWSALGSARRARRRPARALAVPAAAQPRRRPVDPAAQRDLRHDGDRPRALRHRARAARAAQPDGPTIVSLVPRRSRGCSTPACDARRALRWALLGGAPLPPRCSQRARAAGVPVAPTYGLTEACSQVATRPASPLFCTAACRLARRRRDRSSSRPDRAPDAAAGRRRCAPATSARLDERRPPARSSAARPTRSSPAARTSRPPRSRPCSRPTPRSPRPRSSAAPTRSGARRSSRLVVLRARRRRDRRRPRAPTAPRGSPASRSPRRSSSSRRAAAHRRRASCCAARWLASAPDGRSQTELPRRQPRALGAAAGGLGVAARRASRRRRARLALDGRRASTPQPGQTSSSSPPAGRRRASSPPSSSSPAGS